MSIKTSFVFAGPQIWWPIRQENLRQVIGVLEALRIPEERHPQALAELAFGISFLAPVDPASVERLMERLRSGPKASSLSIFSIGSSQIASARQRALIAQIRHWEGEDFPEFRQKVLLGSGTGGGSYFFFAPSQHFRTSLVTEDLIQRLKKGKRLLSVGAGPAYLERLLVKRFGISSSQIVLADTSGDFLPTGFERHLFDMRGGWPDLGRFDYILFPESFVAFGGEGNVGNPIDNPGFPTQVRETLRSALRFLLPKGEIRAAGHIIAPHVLPWIVGPLLQEEPQLDLQYTQELLVLKRGRLGPRRRNTA